MSFPLSTELATILKKVKYENGQNAQKISALSRSLILMIYSELTAEVVALVIFCMKNSTKVTMKRNEARVAAYLISKQTQIRKDNIEGINAFSDVVFFGI